MNSRSKKLARDLRVVRAVAAIPGRKPKKSVPPVDAFKSLAADVAKMQTFPHRGTVKSRIGFRYAIRFVLYGKVIRVIANKTLRTSGLNKSKVLTQFLKTSAITNFVVTGGRENAFAENPENGHWILVEADIDGVAYERVDEALADTPLDGN